MTSTVSVPDGIRNLSEDQETLRFCDFMIHAVFGFTGKTK